MTDDVRDTATGARRGTDPTAPRIEDALHHLGQVQDEDLDAVRRTATVEDRLFGDTQAVPRRFGRFIEIGRLGRGGMGEVLKAYDEDLDRAVAIKLLHPGVAGRDARRLEREALALAKLSHPNVVQVYEVGRSQGHTFIAMELMRGQTLGSWAEQPRPWAECLRVYVDAGLGLAAAHAKGLVHRDFKPDNVFIDEAGHVRVLDFGLARQESRTTDDGDHDTSDEAERDQGLAAALTQTGALLGTPAYMSPEQFEGREADARSDQFGFCVALFEALYGHRPFSGRTWVALKESVTSGDVGPRPKGRGPAQLWRVLARGLSPDPAKRWPSMEALLVELRGFIAPRTRRWLVAAVAGGMVAIGLGIAWYASVGLRCEGAQQQLDGAWDDERRGAVQAAIESSGLSYAAETWERVEQRLDVYAQAWAAEHESVCEATRVTQIQTEREMGLRMGCMRERRLALQAVVDTLANSDAVRVDKAVTLAAGLPALDRCRDIEALERSRRRVPPAEDPEVARQVEEVRSSLAAAQAERDAGQYERALQRVVPSIERATTIGYRPLLAEVHRLHGRLQADSGRFDVAELELVQAHALAVESGHDDVVLAAAQGLAYVVGIRHARYAEGLQWGETAVPLARRSGDDRALAALIGVVGSVLSSQGRYVQAEQHHRRALELREASLGADHPRVAASINNLGTVLYSRGDYPQAQQHFRRALALQERVLGPNHPDVARACNNLGNTLYREGRPEQAQAFYRRALDVRERALGADHPDVATALDTLGNVYLGQGQLEPAEDHYRRALRIRERALGADHPDIAYGLNNLGLVLHRRGRHERAEGLHRRALRIRELALGPEHLDVAASLDNLGTVLIDRGEYQAARQHLHRALEIREHTQGATHADVAQTLHDLGRARAKQGQLNQAADRLERALQIWEQALGAEHPLTAQTLVALAEVDLERHAPTSARVRARRAVAIIASGPADPSQMAPARFALARALWIDPEQRARARGLAQQALEAFRRSEAPQPEEAARVEAWLARPE